ncbi:hypothetical protein PHMEG_00017376 [Phytophthora megakarya]|uniref:Uncharacterized protein n=1 Tax=Phytophthora megakarya TaxID=4795 RepID=A0A225VWN5_9STRA|nr:hypothetical protein PHMEG_00017376 [Phytophthora megakarya]
MFSCDPPPLVTVTLLFRSKTKFTDLPHVVTAVSLFLDASVELPLHVACQFGSLTLLDRIWNSSDVYTNTNNSKSDDTWSLRRFLRTDPHYKQYQFTQSME